MFYICVTVSITINLGNQKVLEHCMVFYWIGTDNKMKLQQSEEQRTSLILLATQVSHHIVNV